jgi:uncharacterized protein YhhL (DUF1145 family)
MTALPAHARPASTQMLALLKLGCLVVYAAGLAAFAGAWHGPVATAAQYLAAAFVVVHVLELPFVLRALRTYRGSLASSVVQALLFGMLHSLPLLRAARA